MVGGLWRKWRSGNPGRHALPADQPPLEPTAPSTSPFPQAPLPAWEPFNPTPAVPSPSPAAEGSAPANPAPPPPSTDAPPLPTASGPDSEPRELVFNGQRYSYAALPEDVRQLVQAITSADERIRHRQGTIEALRVGRRAMAQDLRQRLQPLPQLSDNPVP